MPLKRIAIYCGSRSGDHPEYTLAAQRLADALLARNLGVVYGAGNVGLMKVVADRMLAGGGQVWGVIPRKLIDLELAHPHLTETFITESMRERKLMMAQMADAFIALPGGFGTLEELAEVATLTQLNYHDKPVGVLNTRGYYDSLLSWIQHANTEGFIRDAHVNLVASSADPEALLLQMSQAAFPKIEDQL